MKCIGWDDINDECDYGGNLNTALSTVTRLEIISPEGREQVIYDQKIVMCFQDDNRTLKIFTKGIKENERRRDALISMKAHAVFLDAIKKDNEK